jgi:hypothetical protein
MKVIRMKYKKISTGEHRKSNVLGDKGRMAEAVTYNAHFLAVHASGGLQAGECVAFSVKRLVFAATAGLHRAVAAAVAHRTGPASSCLRGQGQSEIEDAEKDKHDKRNYFFVTPLHSFFLICEDSEITLQ